MTNETQVDQSDESLTGIPTESMTAAHQVTQEFIDQITYYVQSGRNALQIDTNEVTRAEEGIKKHVAEAKNMGFLTWDCHNGFSDMPECKNPLQAITRIAQGLSGNHICVMRNFHIFLRDPQCAQAWQLCVDRAAFSNDDYRRPVIIIGTNIEMPSMLSGTTTIVDFPLPGEAELNAVFDYIQDGARKGAAAQGLEPERAECDAEQRGLLVGAMRGLRANEAIDTLSLCVVKHGRFMDTGLLDTIEDEKAKILRKTSGLTYVHKDKIASEDEVGGFGAIKEWVSTRKMCFTALARENGIDPLKGVVLLGIPGTGKSLFAKVVARTLGQPLVIADINSVFGSLVGESEKRMRDMLNTIDAMQQCVVLIDEADKVWGGANDSTGDSGVTRRIFGSFLTWLQEKESQAFVIMTMNRIDGIPPEFLRKGRFDEIFYTDLPGADERQEIFEIHMRKRGIDDPASTFSKDEWKLLIKNTDGFVGAEIEDVVKTSRLVAFTTRETGTPNFEEVIQAINDTVTLATLDKENIENIRKFCAERARPVSSNARAKVKTAGRHGRHVGLN